MAPLTGLLAVLIAFLAVGVIGGNTPNAKDSAQKVFDFYVKHRNAQMGAAFFLSLGGGLLIFFSATLRHVLARPPARGQLASAAFGGGLVGASGLLLSATAHLALADSGKHGSPTAAQTLNLLDNNTYFPAVVGIAVLVLAAGISIIRTRVLPLWLGIVGVVAGVASLTPAGFFGFLLALLWIAVVSVWLTASPVGDDPVAARSTAA
jgi:hypothetical protein